MTWKIRAEGLIYKYPNVLEISEGGDIVRRGAALSQVSGNNNHIPNHPKASPLRGETTGLDQTHHSQIMKLHGKGQGALIDLEEGSCIP